MMVEEMDMKMDRSLLLATQREKMTESSKECKKESNFQMALSTGLLRVVH